VLKPALVLSDLLVLFALKKEKALAGLIQNSNLARGGALVYRDDQL
jgi:hypothetical protein